MKFLFIIFFFVFPNVSFCTCIGPGMDPTIFPLWIRDIFENVFKVDPEYFITEKIKLSMNTYVKNKLNSQDPYEYIAMLKSILSNQNEESNPYYETQDIEKFEKITQDLYDKKYFSKKEKEFIDEKKDNFIKNKTLLFVDQTISESDFIKTHSDKIKKLHLIKSSFDKNNLFFKKLKNLEILETSGLQSSDIEIIKNQLPHLYHVNHDNDSITPELTKKLTSISFVNQSVADSTFSSLKKRVHPPIKKLELMNASYNPVKLQEIPDTLEELIIHTPTDPRFSAEELIDTITEKFKNLKKLKLVGIKPMTPALMNKIINKLTNLEELNLKDCEIESLDFQETPKKLTRLYLFNNQISNIGESFMNNMEKLTHLGLAYNQIGNEGASSIAKMKDLTHLILAHNQIGNEGASSIAKMQKLTHLVLAHNQIGNEGASSIAKMQKLTELDLSQNKIGNEGASSIAEMEKLQQLHLAHNQISDTGASAIAQTNSPLFLLDLAYNQIGNEGASSIAETKSPLRLLSLSNNQIGDTGANSISSMKELTHLYLNHNHITSQSTGALFQMQAIRDLQLRNNKIKTIESSDVTNMKSITNLDLSYNQIDSKGAGLIAKNLTRINYLGLSHNKIESNHAKEIKKMYPFIHF
jgi:Leucine-rich repeat (LRR) protein